MIKYIRDSLPWLVPSAAIVFAASGFLESSRNNSEAATGASAGFSTVTPQTNFSTATAIPATTAPEVVARAATVDTDLSAIAGATDTAPVQPIAAAPAPQPAPVPVPQPLPEPTRTASVAPTTAPVFAPSTFGAGAKQQCIEDLRNLTNQTRIYFPSGGLTAETSGIEQGRLIGLIAQSCPDVQIRVEGHSDPSGNPAANLRLSQARAEEVIKRIGASGVDTSMFFAEGFGDRQPSGLFGPQPRSYYDRRVQFSVVETVSRVAVRSPVTTSPWASASCVTDLERAVRGTALFYSPRSVSLGNGDLDTAMTLATMAMECPHARLRVIGHHSGDVQAGEGVATGLLRAKALMAMLVGRGVSPEQIIIAAPSRAISTSGLPGSRVDFDVILEEG